MLSDNGMLYRIHSQAHKETYDSVGFIHFLYVITVALLRILGYRGTNTATGKYQVLCTATQPLLKGYLSYIHSGGYFAGAVLYLSVVA